MADDGCTQRGIDEFLCGCAVLHQHVPVPVAAICRLQATARERIAMGGVASHKDLIVWQKSVSLASKVYAATRQLPNHERYGLSSQMRRSAVSIASSIAEGARRGRRAESIQCLKIARSSLSELETQILITVDLQLIRRELRLEEAAAEVGRLLTGLIQKLREQRGP